MDACRETLEGEECAEGFSGTLDPRYRDPCGAGVTREEPMLWALVTGTNRDSLAFDGSAERPAFLSHLLSEDCGLFEPNVPLRRAIELACSRVKRSPAFKSQNGELVPRQEPMPLVNNIPEDFCLRPEEQGSADRFDVCLCYRHDTDSDRADLIEKSVATLACSVFHKEVPGRAEPPEIQIAKALCNSSFIVVVISERTFDGINTPPAAAPGASLLRPQQELAKFLVQLELILEIVEHRGSSIGVLPVYLGDEVRESQSYSKILTHVENAKCWPLVEGQHEKKWESYVRQVAVEAAA